MSWLTVKALSYLSAGLFVLVLAVGGVQQVRVMAAQREAAQAMAAMHAQSSIVAEQRERFQAEARAAEARHAEQLASIEQRYIEDMSNAQRDADRLAAELRAGTVRLRRLWQGCEATTAGVPAAPAAAGAPDADADLRAAAASDLVRIGAECDARVKALQAVVLAQQ